MLLLAEQNSLFGSGDPFHDIPRMVELYRSGDLKLDELILVPAGQPAHKRRQIERLGDLVQVQERLAEHGELRR